MTVTVEGQAVPEASAPALTAVELAAVEKGQQGLSEVQLATPPVSGQRPEGVPEKFWDASKGAVNTEALLKSYSELEKGRTTAAEEPKPSEEKPASVETKVKVEAAPAADTPIAIAMEAARTEWASTQEVTEETVAALEAAGIPREIFNLYIEGVKAQQAATLSELYGYTGDEASFQKMTEWAGKNMTQAQADAYNAALDDPNQRENAVRGLFARYTATVPNEGKLVTPSGTPAASGDVFQNREEFLASQRDPRYKTDAAYRQTVVDKLARSQAAGSMGRVVESSMFARNIQTM